MTGELAFANDWAYLACDKRYRLSDVRYPRFDSTNRVAGYPAEWAIGDDERLAWTSHSTWRIHQRYQPETPMTSVSLVNGPMQVAVQVCDAALCDGPVVLRRVTVRNLVDYPRTLRLIFSHDFGAEVRSIQASRLSPGCAGVIHRFADARIFVGLHAGDPSATLTLRTATGDRAEAILDAGDLDGTAPPLASTTSLLRTELAFESFSQQTVTLAIVFAKTDDDLYRQLHLLANEATDLRLARTTGVWRMWSAGPATNFADVPAQVADLVRRSLLTLRTALHPSHLAVAATSAGTMAWQNDRSGLVVLFAAAAFDQAGHAESARRFLRLFRRSVASEVSADEPTFDSDIDDGASLVIHPALAGTWVWAAEQHLRHARDVEFVSRLWTRCLEPVAKSLAESIDPISGLPAADRPGRFGIDGHGEAMRAGWIDAFTLATMYGGLTSGQLLARKFADEALADRLALAAHRLRDAVDRHLFDASAGRFASAMRRSPSATAATAVEQLCERDVTLRAELFALARFGLVATDDPRFAATVDALCDGLWQCDVVGGLANEPHRSASVLATLWMAQYRIAAATDLETLRPVMPILEWATRLAWPAGLLPRSVDGDRADDRATGPDLWATAEFVLAAMGYLQGLERLCRCHSCGQPVVRTRSIGATIPTLPTSLPPHETVQTDGQAIFVVGDRSVTLAIDQRECLGCGLCVQRCEPGVLTMVGHKATIDVQRLAGCRLCRRCQAVCPVRAIVLTVDATLSTS